MSPLKKLEEVTFNLYSLERPDDSFESILGTVTSSSVRKITFEIEDTIRLPDKIESESWSSLDKGFLKMAKKLGKNLDIVFEVAEKNYQLVTPDQLLKMCLPEATVRICHKSG